MPVFLRRLLLWTVVCVISAAPSFFVPQRSFDRSAMVLGVCLFIFLYTAVTCTEAFERLHRRPFVRRRMYCIIFIFMMIVQLVQRIFCKPPDERRGFAVIMPVSPVAPERIGN